MIKRLLPLIAFVLALLTPLPSFAQTCPGKFPNPLTDICWSCMFPIRIFNANVLSMGQEDALTRDSSLLCSCLALFRLNVDDLLSECRCDDFFSRNAGLAPAHEPLPGEVVG